MEAAEKKKIGLSVFLTIITFGIYGIFWQYSLVKSIRRIERSMEYYPEEFLCIMFVPFYGMYWWYTKGCKVQSRLIECAVPVRSRGLLYVILEACGLRVIAMAILQKDMNTYIDSSINKWNIHPKQLGRNEKYEKAVELLNNGRTEKDYKEALKLFGEIADYKDSYKKIIICEEMIERAISEEEKKAYYKAEDRKTFRVLCFFFGILILFIFSVAIISCM